MKSKVFIKNAVSSIPYSIGKYFTYIPFSWRLGTEYTKSKNNIISFERISKDEQLNYVVTNLNKIVKYATNNFDFYHDFYWYWNDNLCYSANYGYFCGDKCYFANANTYSYWYK